MYIDLHQMENSYNDYKNTAIIVFDLQNKFTSITNELFLQNIKKLLIFSKLRKIPVFWIDTFNENNSDSENDSETNSKTMNFFKKIINNKNITCVNKTNKTNKSVFSNEKFDNSLHQIDISNLIFVGIDIETSIFDAYSLHFKTYFITECSKFNSEVDITEFSTEITLARFTNNFDIFCEGDTFIINNALPPEIYNDDTPEKFIEIENFKSWKEISLKGGKIPRLFDVHAIIENNKIPVYRTPCDTYITPSPPNEISQKYFDWINNNIDVDNIVNHSVLQFYQNSHGFIGQHSDKTLDLDPNMPILNLSLGATKKMILHSKYDDQKTYIEMKSNSILILGPETNKKWLHEVRPDKRNDIEKRPDELLYGGKRISWTFRKANTYSIIKSDNTIELIGQGSPKHPMCDDRLDLICAFSEENSDPEFDRTKWYSNGFWTMTT